MSVLVRFLVVKEEGKEGFRLVYNVQCKLMGGVLMYRAKIR